VEETSRQQAGSSGKSASKLAQAKAAASCAHSKASLRTSGRARGTRSLAVGEPFGVKPTERNSENEAPTPEGVICDAVGQLPSGRQSAQSLASRFPPSISISARRGRRKRAGDFPALSFADQIADFSAHTTLAIGIFRRIIAAPRAELRIGRSPVAAEAVPKNFPGGLPSAFPWSRLLRRRCPLVKCRDRRHHEGRS